MKQMLLILLVAVIVIITTHLTGCGTIGGALSGIGSDFTCAGEWCADLGAESSYSSSGDYRPPSR